MCVIADRGYDADKFRRSVVDRGSMAVAPHRRTRKRTLEYDACLYGNQRLVECFIGNMKQYRKAPTRYDKLARRYRGFIHIVIYLTCP